MEIGNGGGSVVRAMANEVVVKGVALLRGWRRVPLALSSPHEGIPFPLWAGEWQTPAVEQYR